MVLTVLTGTSTVHSYFIPAWVFVLLVPTTLSVPPLGPLGIDPYSGPTRSSASPPMKRIEVHVRGYRSKGTLETPGIEPGTPNLQTRRSTTELHPLTAFLAARTCTHYCDSAILTSIPFNPRERLPSKCLSISHVPGLVQSECHVSCQTHSRSVSILPNLLVEHRETEGFHTSESLAIAGNSTDTHGSRSQFMVRGT